MRRGTRLMALTAGLALVGGGVLGCTTPGGPTTPTTPTTSVPGTGGVAIGPAPTDALLNAPRGPFTVEQVRGDGSDFNSGTVYYPSDPNLGRLGAVVVVPGYTAPESSIQWWGPRLASHGFVVMTIATNSTSDNPTQRAQQQNAAFRWLTTQSPVASRIDGTRLAAAGWSMGGGGSLEAARSNPDIKVVVPMAPWNPGQRYTYSKPTFILSCSDDTVARNGPNSDAFYEGLTGPKAQLTISGSHFCPTTANDTAARHVVSWLKRFLDGDTRYSPFVCPGGRPSGAAEYRNTCPV